MPELTEETFARGSRLAARAALRDIKTFALSAELRAFPIEGQPLRYEFSANIDPELDAEDSTVIVHGKYSLRIYQDEFETASGEAVGQDQDIDQSLSTCEFVIAALYEVNKEPTDREFTDEERKAFSDSTAQFALYPYARQMVNDLTSRIGLPPLTLPTLQVSLSRDPATQIATEAEEV